MSNMSAADMFALLKREPVSNFSKNNQNKPLAKMASGAIAAVSVMLATQLKADAEDKTSNDIDGFQTSSLGNSDGETSLVNAPQQNAVDNVLGSAVQEVASLSQQFAVNGSVQLSASAASSVASSLQAESGRLPRDFSTQSPGVDDPAQQTGSIESEIATFQRGQATNTSNGSGPVESLTGADGQDGADGRNGIDGLDGANGINGIDGQDGADGRDGINGQDGTNGRDGIDGQDGANGINGIDGQDGADGRDGINGQDGTNGRDGIDGQDGADGRDGIDGQDGANGINGIDGQDGTNGRDGIDGLDGADGRDGIDGQDGADGRDGIDGQDGANGINGIDGQDGANGINGIDGQDGANGRDGIDGQNGTNGRDGIDGQDGTNGRDGIDGQDGANGINGIDGQDGANGINGIDGQDGADGRDGIDGQDGANGINGIDGQDGTNGRDGIDGLDGADGRDGIDGQDGADGQTIVFVDNNLFQQSGLATTLAEQGVGIAQGPLGTVALTLTSDQLDIISNLALPTAPVALTEEEAEHLNPISGTDQEDFIEGTDGDDILSSFGADDVLIGGEGADTLLGGDGSDTASFAGSSEGVFIDLFSGENFGGEAEGDTFTSIENLIGTDFEDVLAGDDQSNRLTGGKGIDALFGDGNSDILHGGAGGDVLDGGSSNDDLATYFDSDAAVSISLSDDTASGGHAEGDELDNIESLNGSLFDDFLQGDNQGNRLGGLFGEDVLLGEGGNDTLLGGNSADIIDGGSGSDTSDYTASLEGVIVSLETGVSLFGEAEGDILISIENLAGSAFDDTLSGDDGVNRLSGRDGDDSLFGNGGNDRLVGGLGADHLDGGEGNRDAADYSAAQEAVGVDLIGNGFAGEATGDTFESIEFIVGSDHHDTLLADDGVNRVNGGEGCDVIFGRGGNDILLGEEGDDILNGGEGNDVFIFDFGDGNDIIEDFEAGAGRTDRLQLNGYEFEDFEDLQSSITDTEDGALLSLEDGSILFQNLSVTDFTADDFIVDFTNEDLLLA